MAIKFDLSDIPQHATIKSATLSFYVYGHGIKNHTGGAPRNTSKSVYRITANWRESNINWNNKPRFNSTAVASSNNSSISTWENYNVTTAIKDIIENGGNNYGFLLKFPSETGYKGARIRSSEYSTTTNRPKLTIVFENDTEAPQVNITSPNSSTQWEVGTNQTIKWTASDNRGVVSRAVYFSFNGVSDWALLDSASGNELSYSWPIPNKVSTDCKIRVYAYDAAGNRGNDLSDKFSIIPHVGIVQDNQLNLPIADKYRVMVYNIQGKKIASFEIRNLKQLESYTSALSSGIHIVDIQYLDNKMVRRFSFFR